MLIESLGGDLMGTIPLGDIVLYLNPLHIFLFVTKIRLQLAKRNSSIEDSWLLSAV